MTGQVKSSERINQKKRTRAELLRAAHALIEQGIQPTIAEVADHAGISKATAYRYFSKQDDLIREAALDAVAATIHVDPSSGGADPEERVVDVIGRIMAMVDAEEPMFRALLASTANNDAATRRGGRRTGWLDAALAPLRDELPGEDYRRLVHSLSLLCGIETTVVLEDVCGLDREEARDVYLWAARRLVRAAIA
ncbi:TetR/AcrR family transcriptional regulator [Agrobacterium sp. ES01]|uniref:TetR/AcrR family transcriptional regulator n=1 Tax=Agrobacterium sp. ES01 TaxID=3420714 RepID=UPI003D0BC976